MPVIDRRRFITNSGMLSAALSAGSSLSFRDYPALKVDALCYNIEDGFAADELQIAKDAGLDAVVVDVQLSPRIPEKALEKLPRWHDELRTPGSPGYPVLTAADFHEAKRQGKIGVVLACQDASILGNSASRWLERLETYHGYGLRVLQLTHNQRTHWGDSYQEARDGGLSMKGRELVLAMNEMGMIVDVSHCSEATKIEAAAHSRKPIAMTHIGCYALAPTARNATDDAIVAIGGRGGYIGIFNISSWLSREEPVDATAIAAHMRHVIDLVGPGRVGFASDGAIASLDLEEETAGAIEFNNAKLGTPGQEWTLGQYRIASLNSPARVSLLHEALVSTGFSSQLADACCGENFVRFFKHVVG